MKGFVGDAGVCLVQIYSSVSWKPGAVRGEEPEATRRSRLHLQQPSNACSVPALYHPQVFIRDLVWNLFGEGNDVFREGDWTKSIEMYAEALNVAEYAHSEGIGLPAQLLEKLYANRAAAYLSVVPVSRRGRPPARRAAGAADFTDVRNVWASGFCRASEPALLSWCEPA